MARRTTITIATLVLLLVLTLGYIGAGAYGSWKQQKDMSIFQQGAQYGYEQGIIQMAQQAVTCEQVPLIIENQTINMIAVDCLKQIAGTQAE